ncbi:hypothetical protein [Pseudomonas sp. MAG002Y]|uniref:hypothetical protein n=1 Tax=Pseudomonas sp. MAG002Y TaxID=2678690 RepID=UPI001C610DF4|nr:hypothetical protein [Pseudomonas sp. MAG002Y]MBW5415259.1 hypothetical protein [Pseudomonas sp. MAG002Y]
MVHSRHAQFLELQLCDLEYIRDLDCDGSSACVQYLSRKANYSFQLMQGQCVQVRTGHIVIPHYWIELSPTFCAYLEHPQDELVTDSNLRKWLFEDESVPHGVFAKTASRILTILESVKSQTSAWTSGI